MRTPSMSFNYGRVLRRPNLPRFRRERHLWYLWSGGGLWASMVYGYGRGLAWVVAFPPVSHYRPQAVLLRLSFTWNTQINCIAPGGNESRARKNKYIISGQKCRGRATLLQEATKSYYLNSANYSASKLWAIRMSTIAYRSKSHYAQFQIFDLRTCCILYCENILFLFKAKVAKICFRARL